jgi:hypothetical protein
MILGIFVGGFVFLDLNKILSIKDNLGFSGTTEISDHNEIKDSFFLSFNLSAISFNKLHSILQRLAISV